VNNGWIDHPARGHGGVAGGVALSGSGAWADDSTPAQVPHQQPAETVPVTLHVNGETLNLVIDQRTSLLDALREYAGLTGTKKGCDRGACGACTVHLDGRRIVSCLALASRCQGKPVTTIEGLAAGGQLHPVQAAFIDHDGLQCGYCTPGQIMSAVALIKEGHAGTDSDIREWMSGNICRCGAYPNIVAAVRQAAREG
jgi:xanthine dehydrogenase YagT iron-sulfur-binding subunit